MRHVGRCALGWVDDHTFATGMLLAVPAVMTMVAWKEQADWFTAALAVGAGLCWTGVLLPTAVRQTSVLIAGGVAAICGALVSIMFSQALNTKGVTDPAFVPMLSPFQMKTARWQLSTIQRSRTV